MNKKKKKAQLPFRLNILFFLVFLLFSALIIQLGVVQILNGEAYQEEIDQTIKDTIQNPVPRGKIYDRYGNIIVDNEALYSITYTPPKGVQAKDKLKVAEKLAKYISMSSKKDLKAITERNKQEYWYLKNEEKVDELTTEEEKKELDDAELYNLTLKRIPEEELEDYSKEILEVIAIKREIDKAFALTPQIIKNKDITTEEYARVAEHLDELPGVNATTDWNRKYPEKDLIRGFLGSVSSQAEGIPAEKEQYYLTRGYSRNDRVGKSGLEDQYEEVLRGRKEQVQYTTNKNHQVIDTDIVVPGERGKDLVLTIDMEFQKKVDEIVRKELDAAIKKHPYKNENLEDALAVVINPKTGELLAMSGQHYNRKDKKFENVAHKTLYEAHMPGSTVKGATVLAGFESGVMTPNQTIVDKPMKIGEGAQKGSYAPLGVVNDLTALERSSNVYMFYTALRMGGEYNYQWGKPVTFNSSAFQQMRNYFNQFGLGVKTGIDFPFESTGVIGSELKAGLLMDYAIGQYDAFTTMQLAQYVATIANDGYRVRPHFVKEIRNPVASEDELGPVYRRINTEIMNRIQMDMSYIERVQEGFRRAFQGSQGTARNYFQNKEYNPAGKTGTAESFIKGIKSENLSLVGYAPFEDPEIAFAIIVPYLGSNVSNQHPINNLIGQQILDVYFDLQKERNKAN